MQQPTSPRAPSQLLWLESQVGRAMAPSFSLPLTCISQIAFAFPTAEPEYEHIQSEE